MCWFVQQKGLNWQKCPDSDLLLHLCFCCLRPPQVHPGGPGPAHEVTGGSEGAGVASAQRPAGIGRWHHRIRDSPGGSQGGDMTSPAPPDKGLRIAPKHKPGPAPLPCLPRPAPSRRLAPPRPHAPMPQTHTPACHGAQKTPFSYGPLRCERQARHLPEPRPLIVTLFMLQALDDDIIGRSSIRARHFLWFPPTAHYERTWSSSALVSDFQPIPVESHTTGAASEHFPACIAGSLTLKHGESSVHGWRNSPLALWVRGKQIDHQRV